MAKKRDLSPGEGMEAVQMINKGMSWGQVARHFGVNKPSLAKSLGIWKTGERKTDDGKEYRMFRGRAIFKNSVGFDLKDLPAKT